MARRRTLLCVLDWGLGHATRSLALLDHPLLEGDEVIVASSGAAAELIRRERPDLPLEVLPAYAVRYPTRYMPLNVALQLPKWSWVIAQEYLQVQRLIRRLGVDRIVSDNRFGCYSEHVPSVLLTHQLHPITGSRLVDYLYRRYLQRFDEFWVPDAPARPLSGKLSAEEGYRNVRAIGPLSRFDAVTNPPDKDVDLLILLSGPEPMRTQLETLAIAAAAGLSGRTVLVRGRFDDKPHPVNSSIRVHDFADTPVLAGLLSRARCILCRSGYSTLMDIAASAVSANLIYVPTPGQTEQQYLARAQVRGRGQAAAGHGGRKVAYFEQREIDSVPFKHCLAEFTTG